jgi:hypothetical protein
MYILYNSESKHGWKGTDVKYVNLKLTTKIPILSASPTKLERQSYENHTRRCLQTLYFQVYKPEMNDGTKGIEVKLSIKEESVISKTGYEF